MIIVPGASAGDIEGVTAGDGLSGTATSGTASLAVDLGTNPGLEFASNKLQIAKGISQHDVAQFAAGVEDNDFLRVDGTTIEGLSDSETLSAIGGQATLTFGISNTNAVKVDSASVADDEYARFTANGLESRSTSEVLSDIGGAALTGSTDNTIATVTGANALAGEANLTFDGSTLAVTGAVTVSTDLTVSGGDIVYGNGQNATASVTATAHDAAGRNLTITAGPTTAGTSNNQAGGALTLQGGQGKGSGAGGDIVFQTANASGSGSSLNSHATALTLSDDLSATFAGAVDLGSNTLTSTGSMQIRTIDYSDGDLAMTIADGGGVTFAQAVDLGSNTLTTTGSLQIRTIDYSDGDNAITIADGGGVTFAQDITLADDKSITLGDEGQIIFNDVAPTTDHSGTGIVIKGTLASGVAAGMAVYLKADGEYDHADKDTEGHMPAVGVALEAAGSDKKILIYGVYVDASLSLTRGEELYVGDDGAVTHTVPGSGDFLQRIGVALTTTSVLFMPSLDVIEHA